MTNGNRQRIGGYFGIRPPKTLHQGPTSVEFEPRWRAYIRQFSSLFKEKKVVLEAYRAHVQERAELGIPPKPLDPEWTAELVELLKAPPAGEEAFLLDLIANRVPPGVDEAAYVKAGFLSAIVTGEASSPLIDAAAAVKLLGNMHGGYNVATLVNLLDNDAPDLRRKN